MNPLISIIVPVYNAGEYLTHCIQSILDNDYKEFELLLVLDEPEDGSDIICKEFAEKDSRIRVINIPHSGPSAARNKGIEESRGEWLTFVDHDDFIEHNRFTAAIDAAKEYSVQIVACAINVIYKDEIIKTLKKYEPGIMEFAPKPIIYGMCTNLIYDAKLIKDNGVRFPDCTIGDDSLFAVEAFFLAEKLYNLGTPLYNLRRGHPSLSNEHMSNRRVKKMFVEADRVIEKYKDDERYQLFHRTVYEYLLSRHYFHRNKK